MFDLVHQMRSPIIKSPAFSSERILGAILFERTMDSLIEGKYSADYLWEEKGIFHIVDQQFDIARQIWHCGLVPIVEPEVDIHCPEKEKSENLLLASLLKALDQMDKGMRIILKLTIPTEPDLYCPLINNPRVIPVVALSGGYTREEANETRS